MYRWIAVALLMTSVAGCLSDDGPDVPDGFVQGVGGGLFEDGWWARALPFGDDHDHADPTQHMGLSTPNFEVVGHDDLSMGGTGAGGYGCASSNDAGGRSLSITNSFTSDTGLIVTDITDRAAPRVLGQLELENTHVYDNVLSPDNQYALIATTPFGDAVADEILLPAARPANQVTWTDPCGHQTVLAAGPEDNAPYASGVVLVDLSDPSEPTIADYVPQPVYGAHSIRAFRLGELDLIVSSVAGAGSQGIGGGSNSYWTFWTIEETPLGAKLMVEGQFYPDEHAVRYTDDPSVRGVHDMWVHQHPVTGERIGYFADIDFGAWIVNMDDLALPEVLSFWDPRDVFGFDDFITHGLQPIEGTWEGRHYTIGHEECSAPREDLPTCLAWIMDTTDPRDIRTIGAWTLPVESEWTTRLMFSLHYTGILDRTLLQTNYHGGVWAIDLGPDAIAALADDPSLRTTGVFIPADPDADVRGGQNAVISRLYGPDLFTPTPLVLDIDVLEDGTIVLYDINSGIWLLRFDADDPAPSPDPWPLGEMFDFDEPAA